MEFELEEKILHFIKPARTSRGAYDTHRMILVKIKDGEGRVSAVGECAPLPDLSSDRNAYDSLSGTRELLDAALASGNPEEFLREYPALEFALASALYCCQDGRRETPFTKGEQGIPINGLVWMSDFDDMLFQVKQKLENGFRCIKIKIGSIDWKEEIRLLSLIRSNYSSKELELRVDANGAFSPSEALKRLEELSCYDIHSIEQPIAKGNWLCMAELCRNSPIPIALDEELIGVNVSDSKIELLETIKPDYVIIKPTLLGLKGAEEWILEARKRGIESWVTSALESNVGLRHVAIFADRMYNSPMMPQGLGTGLLFKDNIPSDIEIRRDSLWICK